MTLFKAGQNTFSFMTVEGQVLSANVRQSVTTTTTINNQGVTQNSDVSTTHSVWVSRKDNGAEVKISFNHEMNLREGNNIICFCVKDEKKNDINYSILSVYNFATRQLENATNIDMWIKPYIPSWILDIIIIIATLIPTYIWWDIYRHTFEYMSNMRSTIIAATIWIVIIMAWIFIIYMISKKSKNIEIFKKEFFTQYYTLINQTLGEYGIKSNYYHINYHQS